MVAVLSGMMGVAAAEVPSSVPAKGRLVASCSRPSQDGQRAGDDDEARHQPPTLGVGTGGAGTGATGPDLDAQLGSTCLAGQLESL